MVRWLRGLSGAALAAVIVLLSGCKGPPPTKVGFNNRLAGYNDKLFALGREWRLAIRPLAYPEENKKQAEAIDVAGVRALQVKAEKTVKEIRDDFDYLDAPRKSEPGKDFREAYEAFLVVQERIASEYFKDIVRIIEDKSLSDDDKAASIREIMQKVDNEESEVAGKLATAQSQFASAHSLKAEAAAALRGVNKGGDNASSSSGPAPKGGGKPGPGTPMPK